MKKLKTIATIVIICLLSIQARPQSERLYYAVEINGILCGYSTSDVNVSEYGAHAVLEVRDSVRLMLKALGQDMNMNIISLHILDTATNKVLVNETKFDTESGIMAHTRTEIFDDYALHYSNIGGKADTIWTNEELIFDSPLSSPYLIEDFVQGGAREKTYQIFDYVRGKITDQVFISESDEELHLAGQTYDVMKFDVYNKTFGTGTKLWMDKSDGMSLQFTVVNRKIYLANSSVIKQISTADLDNSMFARVGKNIPDFMDVSYMKVKAEINSAGEEISVASLNFPGQKFVGTVDQNHIQGVFEIEPLRYDGTNAPPFPKLYTDESLQKYVEPEIFIESDHAEIIEMAEKITADAVDSWDAVVSLSKWVGNEIHGAIPGGTSAINTLRTREGECGSHSRLLAAYCRAVGIPARLSVGCMYSPWYGGSFGQHAWTEVYMGEEIGWVAVDATILEYDYVDAGHIKLGENTTFLPESMEILEYRSLKTNNQEGEESKSAENQHILGPYTNPNNRNVLEVVESGGTVSVDIMGRMMLALKEPDEEGRRYAQLTNSVYFLFPDDQMIVMEKIYAMKKPDEDSLQNKIIPDDFRNIAGSYVISQIQKEFRVDWEGDQLVMYVPNASTAKPLEFLEDKQCWKSPQDDKEYYFDLNDDESVSGMTILSPSTLNKGATAAWIIKKSISEEGLDAAEKKFKELWDNRAIDLEYAEKDMNSLGYTYLSEDKLDEALLVFKLNTEAFPQSSNVYDSYGEALMKAGRSEEAISNYQKSLELNPENENAKAMLEKLQE